MINKITIHLASPRGFCAGVDRAIEIVKKTIRKYGSPVYVRHEIVHNKHVVKDLKDQGVIFIDELDEIKNKSRPVIFSAHGVPKSVPDSAKIKKVFFARDKFGQKPFFFHEDKDGFVFSSEIKAIIKYTPRQRSQK